MSATLYYVHDPMCSWCWAFKPTWVKIKSGLSNSILTQRLLGGLAADNQDKMPDELQHFLQQTWLKIMQVVPGTQFNFDFWHLCEPRRSTWPACRAVIAARQLDAESEEAMIEAIQKAYYLNAENPSNDSTLIKLAIQIGLDENEFAQRLHCPETQRTLSNEIQQASALGAEGFPSLILEEDGRHQRIAYDYNDAGMVLENPLILRAGNLRI